MKVQIEEGATKEQLMDLFVVFPRGKLIVEDGKAYWECSEININPVNTNSGQIATQQSGQKNNPGGVFENMGNYLNGVFAMN